MFAGINTSIVYFQNGVIVVAIFQNHDIFRVTVHIFNTVNIVSCTTFGYDKNIYTNAFGGYKRYQVTKQCVVPFINYIIA